MVLFNNRKKIDPRTELADIDSLRLAYTFVRDAQAAGHRWKEGDVLKDPLGRLSFEPVLRLGVFLVPMAAIAAVGLAGFKSAGLAAGLTAGFLAAIPAGKVLSLLDKVLSAKVHAKRMQEREADFGRFALVHKLHQRLNMPKDIFGPELIVQMHNQFRDLFLVKLYEEQKRQEQLEDERLAKERARLAQAKKKRYSNADFERMNRSRNFLQKGGRRQYEEDRVGTSSNVVAVNPMTGLPTVTGGDFGVDVGGNNYGFNDN